MTTNIKTWVALSATSALLAGLVSTAWGQSAAPPATPAALTPPRLVTFVEAPHPAPDREATVELLITIDAAGVVTAVEVATAAGAPFNDAAVTAARGFVFEPAQKDGQPVAARIRYAYRFARREPVSMAPRPPTAPTTGRLEGKVLDRSNDDPLVGAVVTAVGPDGLAIGEIETSIGGIFRFDALAPGAYRIRVTAFEYGEAASSEMVEAGLSTEVTYRLDLEARTTADGEEFGATARVEAPSREVVRRRLTGDELGKVAGTRGDALRSVELLPGVARPPAGQGMLIVRGSSPWDSGVYVQGIEVPLLYHFGGLTSFTNSNLLKAIDLYPGNFSARYGRKIGGVIDVELRDPRTDRVHGIADINLIDTALLAEGPVTRDVSVLVAARRSYLDFWLQNVIPAEDLAITAAPVYWDYQAAVVWKPSASDRVRLIGYGSTDELALILPEPDQFDPSVRGELGQRTGFHRGQLEWKHRYSDKVEHDITLTAGTFQFDFDIGAALHQNVDGRAAYGRAEWRAELTPRVRLATGLDVSREWGEMVYRGPRATQFEGNPEAQEGPGDQPMGEVSGSLAFFRPAAYAEVSVRPTSPLEIIAGVRADWFGDTEQVMVDPRLVTRYAITPSTTLKAAAGLFSQPPNYGETVEGMGNPELDAIRAVHLGTGVDVRLAEGATVGVDGFYKDIDGLVVNSDDAMGIDNGGTGRIYGLELSARMQPGGRFSGFLSYTLSRSERNDDGTRWRLFDIDQTHILSAAGSWKLGGGWMAGGTLRLTTGNPTTPVTASIYDANTDRYRPIYGQVNSERVPTFHQLDLRLEKQWAWGNGNTFAAYLDLQNAYNARHVESVQFNYDYTQTTNRYGLPVLPSLGLRAEM